MSCSPCNTLGIAWDLNPLNMDVFLVCVTKHHILSLQLAIANKVRDTLIWVEEIRIINDVQMLS